MIFKMLDSGEYHGAVPEHRSSSVRHFCDVNGTKYTASYAPGVGSLAHERLTRTG